MTTQEILLENGYLWYSKDTKLNKPTLCTTAKWNRMIEAILDKNGIDTVIEEKHIIEYLKPTK